MFTAISLDWYVFVNGPLANNTKKNQIFIFKSLISCEISINMFCKAAHCATSNFSRLYSVARPFISFMITLTFFFRKYLLKNSSNMYPECTFQYIFNLLVFTHFVNFMLTYNINHIHEIRHVQSLFMLPSFH